MRSSTARRLPTHFWPSQLSAVTIVTEVGVLSRFARPRQLMSYGGAFRASTPAGPVQAELDARLSVALTPQPDGRAVIETSTVIFGKDGRPCIGIAVRRLADSTRRLATTRSGDATTLERLLGAADPLGAVIAVTAGGQGANRFVFDT